MPSTATARNRLEKQGAGENSNTWGTKLNVDLDLIDESIDGVTSFTLSGSKTLTNTNYVSDEARKRVLNITGGTGGTVTIPNVEKVYLVRNGSTGSVIITTGSGTTATIPTLIQTWVFCDGSNAVYSIDTTDLWTYQRLSSDFTYASSNVAGGNTQIIIPAASLTADHEYEYEGVVYAKITSGSLIATWGWMPGLTANVGEIRAMTGTAEVLASGTADLTTAAVAIGSTYKPIFIRGHLIPSSSKSGNCQLYLSTSSGTPTITARAGSFLKYRRTYP